VGFGLRSEGKDKKGREQAWRGGRRDEPPRETLLAVAIADGVAGMNHPEVGMIFSVGRMNHPEVGMIFPVGRMNHPEVGMIFSVGRMNHPEVGMIFPVGRMNHSEAGMIFPVAVMNHSEVGMIFLEDARPHALRGVAVSRFGERVDLSIVMDTTPPELDT